jgi:hypothetical protein
MRQSVLCIIIILGLFTPKEYSIIGGYDFLSIGLKEHVVQEQLITPMQALDLAKERYAANFDKVTSNTNEEYYYKLPYADYYLVYEGSGTTEESYVIHLYEFVLDEPEIGIGHTVTYGWYTIDKTTGEITNQTQE